MYAKISPAADVNYVYMKQVIKDEHRSDTDSGRSSIHGDKDIEPITKRQPSKLKVIRGTADPYVEPQNSDVDMEKKPVGAALQVIRRKDAILRRKNMQRRNTIDGNCSDLLKAANGNFHYGIDGAKSTNCLDKVGTKDSYDFSAALNGSSMPGMTLNRNIRRVNETNSLSPASDLSKANRFHTLPNLRVRRGSRIVIGSSDDGSLNNVSSQSEGPEFILNSSLPCQEIDITDGKVINIHERLFRTNTP